MRPLASNQIMSLWLTSLQLRELTGFAQRTKQLAALAELKVKFRLRPADGFPLVESYQFTEAEPKQKKHKLDFSSVEG